MSTNMQERPADLSRRGPKPSPMEDIDPIDVARPAVPAAAPAAPQEDAGGDAPVSAPVRVRARTKPARKILVQLNTKVAVDARQILDDTCDENGRTIQANVETGILLVEYLAEQQATGSPVSAVEIQRIYDAAGS